MFSVDYSDTLVVVELLDDEIDGLPGASATVAARCRQLTVDCATFARVPGLHRTASPVLQARLEHRSRPSTAVSFDIPRSRRSLPHRPTAQLLRHSGSSIARGCRSVQDAA